MRYFIYFFFFLYSISASGQIFIDEVYDDWPSQAQVIDDIDDVPPNRIDLHRLWVDNDRDQLYFRFTIDNFELNIQNGNSLAIYIDYDQDINTGERFGDIGADLIYNFGDRFGELYDGSISEFIGDDDIQLITSPTVTSRDFELSIRRINRLNGRIVQPGNQISVIIADGSTGDRVPNDPSGYNYTLDQATDVNVAPTDLEKPADSDFRVLSLNVLRDQMFESDRWDNYERVFRAIAPDIVALQEVRDNGAVDATELLDRWYPHPLGAWNATKVGGDIILCSPYPILTSANIRGNGIYLMEIKGEEALVINTHLFCCENDLGRQDEVDDIMAFIRRAQAGQGPIPIAEETPIIILGDKNFVGLNEQRNTLLTGDIKNEGQFGVDFKPDWDNTDFSAVNAYVTGTPFNYTWRGDNGSFSPGRLDYIIYSDAVLDLENAFTVNTRTMNVVDRVAYGLNLSDTDIMSDHLPVVADFSLLSLVSNDDITEVPLTIYPNPVDSELQIQLKDIPADATYRILSSDGAQVQSGTVQAVLDVSQLITGSYILEISSADKKYVHRFLKI